MLMQPMGCQRSTQAGLLRPRATHSHSTPSLHAAAPTFLLVPIAHILLLLLLFTILEPHSPRHCVLCSSSTRPGLVPPRVEGRAAAVARCWLRPGHGTWPMTCCLWPCSCCPGLGDDGAWGRVAVVAGAAWGGCLGGGRNPWRCWAAQFLRMRLVQVEAGLFWLGGHLAHALSC